jgi:hypothetical protein
LVDGKSDPDGFELGMLEGIGLGAPDGALDPDGLMVVASDGLEEMILDGDCEGSAEGNDVMGIGATGVVVGSPRPTGASVPTPLLLPREGISLGELDGNSGSDDGAKDPVEGIEGVVVIAAPEGLGEALIDGDCEATSAGPGVIGM